MIIIGVAIAIILGAVVTFLFLKRRKANGKVKNKNNKK
jgi:phosphotransferase system  glucose/maltose/N-acetylglucosamine-specific IIC component